MRIAPALSRYLGRSIRKAGSALSSLSLTKRGALPFDREANAVLAGIALYESDRDGTSGNRTLLRRNVHRLEKALTMRPRRSIFALDFIDETVDAYAKLIECANSSTLRGDLLDIEYAGAVLETYFDAVDDALELQSCKRTYKTASQRFRNDFGKVRRAVDESPIVPYQRPVRTPMVPIDQFQSLAYSRRSVRWFSQKPVARDLVDKALSIGIQAPSACNRQPFRFIVLDDPASIGALSPIPMGTKGYSHQIPVFIVVIGQQRHFHDPRDRHIIYIDSSLAVMGALLAFESMGLGACCINWPEIDSKEEQMRQRLSLAADERPIMCLAIGWPLQDGLVASSPKKEIDEVRVFNPPIKGLTGSQAAA